MKKISFFLFGSLFILLMNPASASCQYGSLDVYYNDILLPGEEIAKPLLKIGEPFKLRFDFTVYQRCYVSVKLSELGENNFVIIDGPTSRMDEYRGKIMEDNLTETFEWTVKPTENWAGGSLPIDFVYQIDELGAGGDTLLNSGFTVAYCTISNEHYKGKVPSPSSSPSESVPSSNSTASESTPAFTILASIFVLTLVSFRR